MESRYKTTVNFSRKGGSNDNKGKWSDSRYIARQMNVDCMWSMEKREKSTMIFGLRT